MDAGLIKFGGFGLDTRLGVLWHGETSTRLGARAADLLVALAAAPNGLVSKDALMQAAWPGQIVEENTLQAQISSLRKALRRKSAGDAGEARIVTVPGRGYRLVCETDPASPVPPRPGGGRPSLAVLAFDNLSGEPADECISDGIAEDLITDLSRSRSWLVVSRNSSFTFKGRRIDIRDVGRELGVRYVLEGSVRRAGDRLRVNAQLIEAAGGTHIWADRYDRVATDLFALQDEITTAVTRAVASAVEGAEHIRVRRKRPESLDAWEAFHRARSCQDAGEWDMVDTWLRRSIELDPRFGLPHAFRALYLFTTATAGRMGFRDGMAEAEDESRAAIRIDADDANGHAILSMCRANSRDWTGALYSATRATELGPSNWLPHCAMAMAHIGLRSFDRSERQVETMHQIGPRGSGHRVCLMLMANLQFLRGDYAAAAVGAEALITASPFNPQPYWILLASLGLLGRRAEAAGLLARWQEAAPGQSVVYAEMGIPWMAKEDSDLAIEGMRAAGWKGEME
jgi:adenylate cyclase